MTLPKALLNAAGLLVLITLCAPGRAGTATTTTSSSPARTTSPVALNFAIQIDKFLFFRLGDGALPTPGGTPSSIGFTLSPSIPALPTVPTVGNNTAVNWNGSAPSFAVTASGNVLPVEVRSNGGQVSLRASVATALTSGSNTIPMSEIVVTSSDANLPAPVIPASGIGNTVSVPGGGNGAVNNLVTIRSATWTFGFANSASWYAGNYSGQLQFTASTP